MHVGVGLAARGAACVLGGAAGVLGLAIRLRGSLIVQPAVLRELAAMVAGLPPVRAVGLWSRAPRGRLPDVDSAGAARDLRPIARCPARC